MRRGLQRNPTIRQPRRRVSVHPVIPETNDVVAARLLPVSAEEHSPRRPGRPRRTPQATADAPSNVQPPPGEPRRRGRPRRTPQAIADAQPNVQPVSAVQEDAPPNVQPAPADPAEAQAHVQSEPRRRPVAHAGFILKLPLMHNHTFNLFQASLIGECKL